MIRTAILSNVNLDLLIRELKKAADQSADYFEPEGYGEWTRYALEAEGPLKEYDPSALFLILDGTALFEEAESEQEGDRELNRVWECIHSLIRNYSAAEIYLSDLDFRCGRIRPLDEKAMERVLQTTWERHLEEAILESSHVHRFPLAELSADMGRERFYSDQLWYMGSIPYSMEGMGRIRDEISAVTGHMQHSRCKMLILDLDQTLWGGIIGEDGIDGVVLGRSGKGACYRDAQKEILQIQRTGVILSIVSKNNPEDVEEVFRKNDQMVLKPEHFVSIKTNWEPKSENILDIARELNLNPKDFVFLDDNPVEREEVRQNVPGIHIAEFPNDPAGLPVTIRKLYEQYFATDRVLAEDQNKTKLYQQEEQRVLARSSAVSMEDFLKGLQVRIAVSDVDEHTIDRCVQLIGKTNQFNTNTLRMNLHETKAYLAQPEHHIYAARVKDRYGDNGLTAVLMVRIVNAPFALKASGSIECPEMNEDRGVHKPAEDMKNPARQGTVQEAVIDNFLMSCRVMGRRIEDALIAALENHLAEQGVQVLRASYVDSGRNHPVADLWERLGFQRDTLANSKTDPKDSNDSSGTGEAMASYRREIARTDIPFHTVDWT